MDRKEGWELRLAGVFARYQSEPFDWERHNCVTFAGEVVRALTGEHALAYPSSPSVSTPVEAARALAELGGLEVAATAVLGAPIDGWKLCRRGDIALVEQDGRPLLMACAGSTLCGPSMQGLAHLPLRNALKVWRVG